MPSWSTQHTNVGKGLLDEEVGINATSSEGLGMDLETH